MNTANELLPLRSPKWAMDLFGYEDPKSRCTFWDFVYAAGVPHVRLSERKIMFSEPELMKWIESKTVKGKL